VVVRAWFPEPCPATTGGSRFTIEIGSDFVIGPTRPQHPRGGAIQAAATSGGGHRPEPELDKLSNIIKTFNDQFGNIPWTDQDRIHRLITQDIPNKVAADTAYQNAMQNSDRQNARIEHDKALARAMNDVLRDDTELFKQFCDNESFRRWLTDTIFSMTYDAPSLDPRASPTTSM